MSRDCRIVEELLGQTEVGEPTIGSLNLSTLSAEIVDATGSACTTQTENCDLPGNGGPPNPSPHVAPRLIQRRIYCGGRIEPREVLRMPVEISITEEKIRGIIDSGSERSYLSESAYRRVKKYQIRELAPDASSTAGVRLGDRSIVKTLGGTGFVIDIGDVYGPQWFSILPGLSGDLILGMDFWLTFKVAINPFLRTWSLAGSNYTFPLSHRLVAPIELQNLTVNQTQKLKEFLDTEFEKFDRDSTGGTDLITHVIDLDNPTPHRRKPYRRSELIRKFINEETDRLLKKGYITWSNSEWACSPVIAPKANGGLRFCINYQPVNRQTKKPAYPLHNMRSILSQLHQAK